MTQRQTLAAIKAIRGMTATVRDGEFRVTMTLDAIAGRYAGTRKQAIARAESMATYTNDPADALGSARDMSFRFFATPADFARRNAEAARQRGLDPAEDNRSAFRADKPFRAFVRTPVSAFNFDFPTLEAAREYVAEQVDRADGIAAGRAPAGPRYVDPMDSFIVWPDGVETLADSPWNYAPPAEDRFGDWVAAPAADALADIKVVGTIDLTPTWAAILPLLLAGVTDGTDTGRRIAKEELARMATLADGRNDMAPALLALATVANETAHCIPAGMAREEMETATAAAYAVLGEEPVANPFRDVNAVQVYRLKGDGCQAPGAIVLRHLPDNDCTPYVVHFRNDQDSERTGKPCYYFGDYCRTLADGWRAFADKVARYDPTGALAA